MHWHDGCVLNRHVSCLSRRHIGFLTVLLNAIIADELLYLVIKRNKKKQLYIYYILKVGWKTSFCCSCRLKSKTQYHLNRGMMQYIPVKQAF